MNLSGTGNESDCADMYALCREREFSDIYERYAEDIYRLCYSFMKNHMDAEDAVQSIFLKLIEGKVQPKPGKERAFLIQVTINYCKDILRSAWRKKTIPMDEAIPFEQQEDRELFDAVMALPEKYRIAVYLHYYEGYSFPEIASFLKISPSGVSMRMHRAKDMLKKQLRNDDL